jgi:hypothetical protein
MSKLVPIYQIPVPSTGLGGGGPHWCFDAIRYEYSRDGTRFRSGIRFENHRALRTRAESSCTIWHIDSAYDTLTEVQESPWVTEIYNDTSAQWRDHWTMRHYIIYLDGSGSFEVIAESWEIIPEERGSWKSTSPA